MRPKTLIHTQLHTNCCLKNLSEFNWVVALFLAVLFFAGCKKNPPTVKTLISIAVTSPPAKTTYIVGDTFDPTGMIVTATYSDKSTSEITITTNMLSYDFSTVGKKTVTIIYDEQTTTFMGIIVNAALAITGFSPAEAQHDSIITITGTSFSTTPVNNIITFNGIAATVVSATTTQLTVKVPKNKNSSGKISVTVASNTVTSATNFTYVLTAVVSTLASDFLNPNGVAVDASGNVYVANGNGGISKITPVGMEINFTQNYQGSYFGSSFGLSLDASDNLYVMDIGVGSIFKITLPTNQINLVASRISGFGIVVDTIGNLYVADMYNNAIRKITLSTGVVSTIAGSGTGTAMQFTEPYGIAVDNSGNLYVADIGNFRILKIVLSTNTVTVLAGSGTSGSVDGIGTAAQFSLPKGIAFDGTGNLYVADNIHIRKIIIATGAVSTIAGSSTAGFVDGVGTVAQFNQLSGIAIDAIGNIYVTDYRNVGRSVRKITFE